ncbi:hypothetical protein ABBQ32_012495 [Trebouxia sp. C0010 RCD-2024]
MGFLPEKDPETTVASEQADVKKLPNRPPLPGEKLDNSQQLAMDVMAQIQKDAMLDKFLPAVPFLDTVQTPCIMAVGKHHEDGRFMATFLNQVIAWANKSCDIGYPDTCLLWGGFLAKLAIYYDKVSDGHAEVAIMNRVTSRARALKALGDQRTNERVNRGDQVPGVTHVMVEWGVDEYHLVETVTERLRSVNDAVRCLDFLSNAAAATGAPPTTVAVPIKAPS